MQFDRISHPNQQRFYFQMIYKVPPLHYTNGTTAYFAANVFSAKKPESFLFQENNMFSESVCFIMIKSAKKYFQSSSLQFFMFCLMLSMLSMVFSTSALNAFPADMIWNISLSNMLYVLAMLHEYVN